MTPDARLLAILRRAGGAAGFGEFEASGIPRAEVLAAVRRGDVVRIRNGWFAARDAPPDVVRAVRVGGVATASTVAQLHGLWVPERDVLHVRVASNASRLRAPHDRRMPLDPGSHGVCVHYRSGDRRPVGRDPLTVALGEMFACAQMSDALAAVESAVETGVLDPGHLDLIRRAMPPGRRADLDRFDFGAQSGLETKVRLFLRSRRVRVRTQAPIDGVGSVDLLVGDRLVIEVDGWSFHRERDQFENDRRRDFELMTRGYLVLRLSYRQVMHDWPRTSAGILALIARGEHRWSGRRPGPHPRVV
ncbi:type IV toxin-antitoxin system AbiEi family antitoxin domain-containing protein [Agromyces sp. LHK192]|uniref:type IV toxin-antitoxin system AbiEi family antitoxin domain-containing protein n=1 Tax=Agromyces sp. LHK192 TaxID=2498704 RepID=UPI000FD7860F|nr:type IV toxin-antitoxin system AbiEi family antitoxin domain-containing protein [Agromyces sp. LHK192]